MSERDNNNKKFKKFKLDIAPDVDLEDDSPFANLYSEGGTKEIQVNLPYDRMVALPKMEVPNPLVRTNQSKGLNLPSGHVDQQHFNDHNFEQQSRTFKVYGYAKDPSLTTQDKHGSLGGGQDGTGYVGDLEKFKEYEGLTTYDKVPKNIKHMPKPKRQSKGDPSILDGEGAYLGPWASYEESEKDETEEKIPLAAPTQTEPNVHKPIDDSLSGKETSIFHGTSEFDYLGRTYMHVPRDLDVNLMGASGEQKCFLPKGQLHTWDGHEKGVSKLEFFPGSGHLLLSCGMDGLAKLWDVYHDRELLRSYKGHTKAIRDIKFNNDGTRFLTAGYDRYLKLWDTETGKCVQSINVGRIPYCATFNPSPEKQHLILAGCSDKKIVQYDLNTGGVVQEYDQHLGGVNSITFVDDNRRFVSTSDDKTLRVWEFDIPVVVKYIAEPYMHSMPSVSKHPSNKWLAAQSLDNQILIFSATDRVKQNNKKSFKGHITSGFACQPNFSPDGKYLISGDASGNLWVWDWQSTKILKKIKAHDNALITCAWHPQETSKVATGSWDGYIKYWD